MCVSPKAFSTRSHSIIRLPLLSPRILALHLTISDVHSSAVQSAAAQFWLATVKLACASERHRALVDHASDICSHFLTTCCVMQTVARDLAAAQDRLTAAGSELKQIASQAEQDTQQLKQARALIAQLQSDSSANADHHAQLQLAQKEMTQAQYDLQKAQRELSSVQAQLSASQKAEKAAQVC